MFRLVQKYNLQSIKSRFLFLLIAAFVLSGCGSQNQAVDTGSSGQDDNVSFQMPEAIFGNKLDQGAGTLTATISVEGGSATPMTISGETASVTLDNIPTGLTTFTILFSYDLDPYGPLDVARAEKTFTVMEGSNSLSFEVSDYDTASFDADGDGISNILELDENSNTSPVLSLCVLGTAELGNCELGS